ncbi:hypothetical protein [Gallibacterium genomosp. 3]|uniref:Uncharacterized protein n=1 Tax=Gallibacterium genomosp. 3 TaxID=505345 RepID=A0A1A7Q125_9PAST|nr:hypothetical protein [Gallibacterium genomosp. 3]OBX07115.1 hypothetical protein QV07_07475 [Gallibacterium genomosp. 3]
MINIQEEFNSIRELTKATYISLGEVIEQIKQANLNVSYQDIAYILYNKFMSYMEENDTLIRAYRLPQKYKDIANFPIYVDTSSILFGLTLVRDYEGDCHSVKDCWLDQDYYNYYHLEREQVKKILNTSISATEINWDSNLIVKGLKNKIHQLELELKELKGGSSLDKNNETTTKSKDTRISQAQRDIFALLVTKNYSDLQTRNKLFMAINLDMKENGIRVNEINYSTFNNLIDEDLKVNGKSPFPPKQK